MVEPTQAEPQWTLPRTDGQPAAYVDLDAFSVPLPGAGATKAEHRMLYTVLLHTPAHWEAAPGRRAPALADQTTFKRY